MQNKANFKTEVRKQKPSLSEKKACPECNRRVEGTEDSKISAKSTPKLRFSVPTDFFYNCRESSTNRPYFLQNKANFQKSQMNVSIFLQMAYENKSNWTLGQNKPNSNPIKPNFRKAQMNVSSLITKGYRRYDDFVVRKNKPNSNPISVKPKMSANLYVIEDYENETAFQLQKNKPKQSQYGLFHAPAGDRLGNEP